jgi:hypothetical protein
MGGGVGTHFAVNGSGVELGTGLGVGPGAGGSVTTGGVVDDELEGLEPQAAREKAPNRTADVLEVKTLIFIAIYHA